MYSEAWNWESHDAHLWKPLQVSLTGRKKKKKMTVKK